MSEGLGGLEVLEENPFPSIDRICRDEETRCIREVFSNYPRFGLLSEYYQRELCRLLEIGVNNCAFDKATMRKIPQVWNDSRYVELYSNIGFNLKINLDITSSVNARLPESYQSYLANMIINWTLIDLIEGVFGPTCASLIGAYIPYVSPRSCAYLEGDMMNPYPSKKYLDEIHLREQQKVATKFTEMYPCPRCGVRRATYFAFQGRGLDEDNTLHITCDACSFSWKKH